MDVDSDGKVTEEEFVRACLSQETISKMLALKVIDVFIWQERNLAFPNSWWSEEKPMKLKTWFQLILLFTHHLYYSNNYSKKQCSIFSLSPKAVDVWISTALLSPLLLQKIKNTTTKILHVPCSLLCFVAWNIQKTYFDLLKKIDFMRANFFQIFEFLNVSPEMPMYLCWFLARKFKVKVKIFQFSSWNLKTIFSELQNQLKSAYFVTLKSAEFNSILS